MGGQIFPRWVTFFRKNLTGRSLFRWVKFFRHTGTRLLTYCWRSCNQLPNHESVNHSLHFVDPIDRSVHTNTIEGMWRHVKDDLRKKKGIPRENLDEHLQEIQWRRLVGDNIFAELLYWLDFYGTLLVYALS